MKKSIIGLCVAFAAFASQAEYLWWQIDDYAEGSGGLRDIGSWAKQELGETAVDSVVARVVAVKDGERVGVSQESVLLGEWYTAPNQSIDISALGTGSSYSYYVEIVKSDYSVVYGQNSVATTYDDLKGSITATLSDIPAVQNIWHGGSGAYKATPEPTSAMLMLLGVAGLALRRKQRKLA